MDRKDEIKRLIDLINESDLFSQVRDKASSAYKRDYLKMIEYLYCYLMQFNSIIKANYDEYALEIVNTAKYCINNYDYSKGSFLTYFNAAWSKEYKHCISNRLLENDYSGIRISESLKRKYVRYKQYCIKQCVDVSSHDYDNKIAETLGISLDEVKAVKIIEESKPDHIDKYYDNEESADSKREFHQKDTVDDIFNIDESKRFLDSIELTYNSIQSRQKYMISLLITSRLSLEIDRDEVMQYFKEKAFFNNEIFYECLLRGERIPDKDLADRLGVLPPSLSRSWKSFVEKLDSDSFNTLLSEYFTN